MTIEQQVAQYLQTTIVSPALTLGTNLFVSTMPPQPDELCVMVVNTGGPEADRYTPIRQVSIQVSVRASQYDTGSSVINSTFNALHQKTDQLVLVSGQTDIMQSMAMQEPTFIGQDTNQRYMFTCNFVITYRP